MRAFITVYEPGDEADPSLPTLLQFLSQNTDPRTGILTYRRTGHSLSFDPAPLRALPAQYLQYNVSPGATFAPHDTLGHKR